MSRIRSSHLGRRLSSTSSLPACCVDPVPYEGTKIIFPQLCVIVASHLSLRAPSARVDLPSDKGRF